MNADAEARKPRVPEEPLARRNVVLARVVSNKRGRFALVRLATGSLHKFVLGRHDWLDGSTRVAGECRSNRICGRRRAQLFTRFTEAGDFLFVFSRLLLLVAMAILRKSLTLRLLLPKGA